MKGIKATKSGKAHDDGTCEACQQSYAKGDRIVWTRPVHPFCLNGAQFTSIPAAPTLEFTRLQAVDLLEEAIKTAAAENDVTDEAEALWKRYHAFKAHALTPGSPNESRIAWRLALKALIDLAYP